MEALIVDAEVNGETEKLLSIWVEGMNYNMILSDDAWLLASRLKNLSRTIEYSLEPIRKGA